VKKEKLVVQIQQLEKAIARLAETLVLKPTQVHQDATIQRYEFTFELAWKTMQSFAFEKGIKVISPKDSIRTAAQLSIIEDIESWFDFLDARNMSSHIYDEKMANLVYQEAKRFLPEVEALIGKLKTLAI